MSSGSLLSLVPRGDGRLKGETGRIAQSLSYDLRLAVFYNLRPLLLSEVALGVHFSIVLSLLLQVTALLLMSPGVLYYPLWLPNTAHLFE